MIIVVIIFHRCPSWRNPGSSARACQGLYIFRNAELQPWNSDLWRKILEISSCSVTSLPESPRHRDVKIQDFTSSAVVACEFQLECGQAAIPDQRSDPPQAMQENPRRICQILVACVEEKEIKESIACSSTIVRSLNVKLSCWFHRARGKSGGGYVKLERKLALKLAASSITAGQATE
ncbi:hypothetical protein SELMODRAFT_404736 [Selaginella moellendorffii]|uniref:Uncharacterized protein n=1 Tax=Selaginella moellendorffii TaxID=88036 RepID=D8QW84_SELML|nr:hypothetical protein SELMODRAFT_404736 [Selaginella moellendorffii]